MCSLRGEVVRYFYDHFSSDNWDRMNLEDADFPWLLNSGNKYLSSPFPYILKIKEVVKSCDGNINHMPDKFNFTFI